LKWGEQARVLRLIPGLENAKFLRYGQIHRNTYICAPALLDETLRLKTVSGEHEVSGQNFNRAGSDGKKDGALAPEGLPMNPAHPILFAGQLSGVEGYTESIATGLLTGIYAASLANGEEPIPVPRSAALGSLVHYITHADAKDFQPANITFDLLETLDEETRRKIRDKKERHRIVCERALEALEAWRTARDQRVTASA
jgi:methylenetetrahydrofolate--tRNA-(uracil-5-)-methyltransferase